MTTEKDILTDEDGDNIVRDLVDYAGTDGIREEDLIEQMHIAMKEIRELKIGGELYQALQARQLRLSVADGGVRWTTPENHHKS